MRRRTSTELLAEPWAIRPASMAAIMDCARYSKTNLQIVVDEVVPEEDMPTYEIVDGIAVITMAGIIGKRLPQWMAEGFGMVDVDDVSGLLRIANADPDVKAILLDIDSPGGTISGVPELAQEIRSSAKTVIAHSDRIMTSAAYWIASGASGIYATESAVVGGVGVFVPIRDIRRAYQMAGMEVDMITSGRFKGAGYPGTSLTPEQREHLQSLVDHAYARFVEFVTTRPFSRPIQQHALEGRDYFSPQAVEFGLLDGIASRDTILDWLKNYSEI